MITTNNKILVLISIGNPPVSKEMENVAGVIVVNADGITVKSTIENSLTMQVRLSLIV